ncbi:hypothetical protein GCM10009687_35560 [Asanoa iriomotensis]|uniref:Serine/threonine protein kinase n=2 Tax=Asanoa iriomotensis TaxID=234613 RepID=A0ABQ4CC95_9ACTN|nr:hypothetical protein Air01nite_64820 [Asanoa iriomotensis]
MKRLGTAVTLVVGLAAGAGLFAANNALTVVEPTAAEVAAPAPTTAAPPTATAPAADRAVTPPPAKVQAPEKVTVTWAGSTRGGAASIAIAVKEGVAVAYVCDGNRVEAWYQGTAVDERLALSGADGRLTGVFDKQRANGTVTAGGTTYRFDIGAVRKPSGLYRATAQVRNAQVRGGWIVVDGRQVGILQVDGVPQPAPPLDLTNGSVVVNGETIVPVPQG